jgi:hypothetical protein
VADRIVLESHFRLDGFATMAKGARAILDADRHLFRGARLRKLRNVFAARGIGPVWKGMPGRHRPAAVALNPRFRDAPPP